ncbi:hypothetical protein EMGBS6_15450 [Opitutia bacterium]|nr:hypothetical protein EMGBS6_15450 [Opitutae bacterium]
MSGRDDERVAMAEDVVWVEGAPPIAVGNGVALKEDAAALAERGDRVDGLHLDDEG